MSTRTYMIIKGHVYSYTNVLWHMIKMAAMPIYDKNLLLWNQKADDPETWYADRRLECYLI